MTPGPYQGLGKPGRALLEFLDKEYWRNVDLFTSRLTRAALTATAQLPGQEQTQVRAWRSIFTQNTIYFHLEIVSPLELGGKDGKYSII
jgi:hypothetical protein